MDQLKPNRASPRTGVRMGSPGSLDLEMLNVVAKRKTKWVMGIIQSTEVLHKKVIADSGLESRFLSSGSIVSSHSRNATKVLSIQLCS